MAPFVMGAGMHNDRPVGFAIKFNGALIGPIVGGRSFGAVRLLGQRTDINPLIAIHRSTDHAAAFTIRGRQTGQKKVCSSALSRLSAVTKAASAT